ncbi:putative membrane protein [Friedmanniella endophytica]|uniref:Putative membrane protein n=1 Tax=Microlunatus kandeliicorticis TaxID=1759536 RepID=A0A7W3IQ96_9ACTN|nr:DUF4190 domain-containing protein [Microlunatus kandeliicorticis]MBA8793256.1 putative membrane protein [Microlunatus kandeliicorticis]
MSYPGPAGPGGYPPYGGYPVRPAYEHPQGTTVLVLGVLSLVVGVTAPFAWYYAVKAEREIRASGWTCTNSSHIQIGKILGIIGTVLLGLSAIFVIIYLVFVVSLLGMAFTQYR